MPGYNLAMNAVWLGIPDTILAERHALGHDRRDELWEGVLHMVPSPWFQHNDFNFLLGGYLRRQASARGLVHGQDPMAVYAPDVDPESWRVPDISIARPDQVSARGFEGAVLVVEVLSPHDESRQKFDFFARVGVQEVWIIEPHTRAPEIYVRAGNDFVLAEPVAGIHRAPLLDITLEVVAGPWLRVTRGADTTEI